MKNDRTHWPVWTNTLTALQCMSPASPHTRYYLLDASPFDPEQHYCTAAQICDASVLHYAEEVKTVLLVDILPNAQDLRPALPHDFALPV